MSFIVVCLTLLLFLQRGDTALHLAAANGHYATVTLLLDKRANKEAKNNVRNTNPLD
jgi:ankyrin repeat protein